MQDSATNELKALSSEYAKYGKTTSIVIAIFLVISALVVVPGLMEFPIEAFLSSATDAPRGAFYAALGGMIAASIAIVVVMSGPIFMLLLAKFLKSQTHYRFCKFAANFLSLYRPLRPTPVEKTLALLEHDGIRKAFRN